MQQLHCYRCKQPFKTEDELKDHQTMSSHCELREHDTILEGLAKSQEKAIRDLGRKHREPDEEKKWATIFRIIFPDVSEEDVPSPCKPCHFDCDLLHNSNCLAGNPMTEDQEAALAALRKELKERVPGEVERDVMERHSPSQASPQLLETIKLRIANGIDNVYQRWTAKTSIHLPGPSKVTKPRRSASATKRKAPEDSSQRDQRSAQTLQIPAALRSGRNRPLAPSTPGSRRGRYSSRGAVRRTTHGSFSNPSMSYGSISDISAEESICTPDQVLPQNSFDSRTPIGQDVIGMQPAGIVADPFKESNAGDIDWTPFSAPGVMNTNASGGNSSMYQTPNLYGQSAWTGMQGQSNSIPGHSQNRMDSPIPNQFAHQMSQMQYASNANMGNQLQASTLALLNMSPPWNANFSDGSFGNNNFSNGSFRDGSFGDGSFDDGSFGNTM
jgi:hypothetical protein